LKGTGKENKILKKTETEEGKKKGKTKKMERERN
jgi:hypothetical protein